VVNLDYRSIFEMERSILKWKEEVISSRDCSGNPAAAKTVRMLNSARSFLTSQSWSLFLFLLRPGWNVKPEPDGILLLGRFAPPFK
jgi:hypothetical protein